MTLQRKFKIVNDTPSAPEPGAAVSVAFASVDRRTVDQHFGAAGGFVIYRVTPARYDLVEITQFGKLNMDGNEDKLAAKITALSGCVAVYCLAVGASAIAQLRTAGIQPIKVEAQTLISGLLRGLQQELSDGPSAWLARAIELQNPDRVDRFDAMEAEGWAE